MPMAHITAMRQMDHEAVVGGAVGSVEKFFPLSGGNTEGSHECAQRIFAVKKQEFMHYLNALG